MASWCCPRWRAMQPLTSRGNPSSGQSLLFAEIVFRPGQSVVVALFHQLQRRKARIG